MANDLQLTRLNLAPFNKFALGFDEVFDRLVKNHEQFGGNNYPPYNIIKKDEYNYALEIAVAGFDLSEIEINTDSYNLSVSGEKKAEENSTEYVYKGISARGFRRSFSLGEHMVVKDAVIKNGMLTINLERVLPDYMKPRKITIKSDE